jgi:hypothetical protein
VLHVEGALSGIISSIESSGLLLVTKPGPFRFSLVLAYERSKPIVTLCRDASVTSARPLRVGQAVGIVLTGE